MPGEVLAALIAVGGLVVINIGLGLFHYGRLSQKVEDMCKRFREHLLLNHGKGGSDESE